MYICTKQGCACGEPVVFRIIDGHVVALHEHELMQCVTGPRTQVK